MKKRYSFLLSLVLSFLLLSIFVTSLNNQDVQVYRSTKIWTSEPSGVHTFFVSSVDILLTQVSFETATELTEAKMIIEAQGAEFDSLKTIKNSYQFITIGKFGINDNSLSNINVQFRIPKEIILNYSNYSKTKLYYYDNDMWVQVDTEYVSSNEAYYYFKASPPKLGYYAIIADNTLKPVILKNLSQDVSPSLLINNSTPANESAILNNAFSSLSFFKNNKNIYLLIVAFCLIMILASIIWVFLKLIFNGQNFENIQELEKLIEEEMSEGVPKKEISNQIIKAGWPKKLVDKLVHNEELPHEIEVKIKAYIIAMRDKLFSDDQIKRALLKEGWEEEVINTIILNSNSF